MPSRRQIAKGMAVAIGKDPWRDEVRGRGKDLVGYIGSIGLGAFSPDMHLRKAARPLDRPQS